MFKSVYCLENEKYCLSSTDNRPLQREEANYAPCYTQAHQTQMGSIWQVASLLVPPYQSVLHVYMDSHWRFVASQDAFHVLHTFKTECLEDCPGYHRLCNDVGVRSQGQLKILAIFFEIFRVGIRVAKTPQTYKPGLEEGLGQGPGVARKS